ncbi:MAG: 16S rRNA (guanine(527)-N(7))-methyltransferase RsmG [Bacilli bacterium]|nr:16S rRNA (guanine(527)-N(7))-methyltransferase RsmG [Bacilli bacterium]
MTVNEFIDHLKQLGIDINDKQLNQLEIYYELLIEWNQKINLTTIVDKKQVYLKHFYDSLTISKIINLEEEQSLCDIGTGAGFPGLVLKILFPNLKVTLVDSLKKRIYFLNTVIQELDLKDIETIHDRCEEYALKNRGKYDVVTARAVAPINILLEYSIPMVKVNKHFIAMKGNIEKEENTYHNAITLLNIKEEEMIKFLLPFENSNRTLIKFKKESKTNHKYPRKFSDIKKKPL